MTLRAGDRLWVHDYHLIPFAEELRRLGVTQPMGFFLHIPLPPPDLWRIVPCHRELMRALCAYDLVGFQTRTDADAFRDYLVREARGKDLGEGVVQAFVRRRTSRQRLRLDHLECREQVGLLVVLRCGLVHALRIRRGPRHPRDPHGRWNGSA